MWNWTVDFSNHLACSHTNWWSHSTVRIRISDITFLEIIIKYIQTIQKDMYSWLVGKGIQGYNKKVTLKRNVCAEVKPQRAAFLTWLVPEHCNFSDFVSSRSRAPYFLLWCNIRVSLHNSSPPPHPPRTTFKSNFRTRVATNSP